MRFAAIVPVVSLLLSIGQAAFGDEVDETVIYGRAAVVRTGVLARFVASPTRRGDREFEPIDLPLNDPTIEGGNVLFYDRHDPSDQMRIALPASGWRAIGGNPLRGFVYRGDGSVADPCRKVLVKAKRVVAVCRGAGITLAPPLVDEPVLGVTLTVGGDTPKRYCPVFGGFKTVNRPGFFRARRTANGGAPCVP